MRPTIRFPARPSIEGMHSRKDQASFSLLDRERPVFSLSLRRKRENGGFIRPCPAPWADTSSRARAQYENEVAINRRRLAEHPTRFGTGTNPSLANRRFVSQDGKYLILYDQSGTPSVALPNKGTYTSYSPEEIDLMSRYYNGDENTDFAERDFYDKITSPFPGPAGGRRKTPPARPGTPPPESPPPGRAGWETPP